MTPDKMRQAIRSLCYAVSVKHAIYREHKLGADERMTDPLDQFDTALFLLDIQAHWKRERKEMGL